MFVYMKITLDEYELPVAVAESLSELANILGIKKEHITSNMSHCKKKGWRCSYIKVDIGKE